MKWNCVFYQKKKPVVDIHPLSNKNVGCEPHNDNVIRLVLFIISFSNKFVPHSLTITEKLSTFFFFDDTDMDVSSWLVEHESWELFIKKLMLLSDIIWKVNDQASSIPYLPACLGFSITKLDPFPYIYIYIYIDTYMWNANNRRKERVVYVSH